MTRRGKFVNERARAYLASQEAVAYQLETQMAQQGWSMLPKQTPLKAEIVVTVPKDLYTFDGENTAKALLDSAQKIVFQNDCWIVDECVVKQLGNGYHVLMIVGTV
jgi:Holliday junction resolvase RusA-like endonuclease